MKVLVVYPTVYEANEETRGLRFLRELPTAIDEVMQVVNLLNASLLTGQRADIYGLLDVLSEGWDVLWLVTHCDESGWHLRDGPVAVGATVSLIRTSGVWLTVMNTCSSINIARQVANELETPVIATIAPVPDRQAMITGTLFAQQLAAGFDYLEAFQRAKPGGDDSPYRLVEAGEKLQMGQDRRSYSRADMPDAATVLRFIRSVEELELMIYGSEKLRQPALRDVVYDLQRTVPKILEKLEDIEQRQRFRLFLMWGIVIGLVILTLIVVVLIVRQGLI